MSRGFGHATPHTESQGAPMQTQAIRRLRGTAVGTDEITRAITPI
jgi:hypothetical protein